MSIDSIAAAQDCRTYLGIATKTYATVPAYINGDKHQVSISMNHNKIELDLGSSVEGYQFFNTDYQDMEWLEDDKILLISNQNPKYSFSIFFPEE